MNWIKKLFSKIKTTKQCDIHVVRLTLPVEEMNEHQLTDVVLGWNFPFMTLTESKLPNVWYHESFDWLCKYTPRGFSQEKLAFKGSKKILFERGFGRQ